MAQCQKFKLLPTIAHFNDFPVVRCPNDTNATNLLRYVYPTVILSKDERFKRKACSFETVRLNHGSIRIYSYFAQYILPFLPLNIRSFYKNILVNDLMAPVHRSSIKRQKKRLTTLIECRKPSSTMRFVNSIEQRLSPSHHLFALSDTSRRSVTINLREKSCWQTAATRPAADPTV